ncbi:MAG: leukotoxin LktA family filamentous adhesin [Leptothrix sp. (in: b-proteobacteria)]
MKKHASLNRIYRLLWNDAIGAFVAVTEFAKGRGKGLSGRRVIHAHWTARLIGDVLAWPTAPPVRPTVVAFLCSMFGISPVWCQIIPDGRTRTSITSTATVRDIRTNTISGNNAFNSFSIFNVATGQTVNLYVPTGSSNLINLVRDEQSSIFGRLNAIKDGQIGGAVYFANPYGMIVGAGGVINVGSLHVSTPSTSFIDGFFSKNGAPDQTSITNLLAGREPSSGSGQISIQGTVNASGEISLRAGTINVGGRLFSGARFEGNAPNFTDVVNVNGLRSATNLIVEAGKISIVAEQDAAISGSLSAEGGNGVRGGDINVQAGGNLELAGANILAAGHGTNSPGGTVALYARNNATLGKGALIDASAGSSGDGGSIEFSAANTVELAGGSMAACATQGQSGNILIDPTNLTISSDLLRSASSSTKSDGSVTWNAGSLTLQASEQLTIANNVVVSTRQVTGTTRDAHINDNSTGNSGNLTLQAPHISLGVDSMLLAQATDLYTPGDITLTASQNFSLVNSNSWSGKASISLDGATIKGGNIKLTASSTYDDSILTARFPVTVAVVGSAVEVTASNLTATGNLTLEATSDTRAATSPLVPLGNAVMVSTAEVNVSGASVLNSGADLKLHASSTVNSKVAPGLPDLKKFPGDAGAAQNVIVSTASTHVGDSSELHATKGAELSATNNVTATTKADSSAAGVAAVGGTVALSEVTAVTQAYIDGSAKTDAASLNVTADSQNTLTTSAKAAAKGANKQTDADKAANPSLTEKVLAKFKNQARTTDGSVEVAAAVAVANVNSFTQAFVASTGQQKTTGATTISSKAATSSTVTADGSSTNSDVGVGAAVGLNIGVLANHALVATNSNIDSKSLTVSAKMPTDTAKSAFATSVTSGSGTSNVGVAGALAVNVLANTTSAMIEATKVKLAGGNVLVEAQNLSASTVTAGAKETPANASQPAQVGIGATVGTNVAVNTTTADVADGAGITGANDFTLTSRSGNTTTTTATGGASGDKVAVTPVAAVTMAVNTTTARLGTGDKLDLLGKYTSSAEQTSTTSSTATGQTTGGKAAIGASIGLTFATDKVTTDVERDITTVGAVDVSAKSTSASSTTATASATGGQKADAKDQPINSDGSTGKTVDKQVSDQGDATKKLGSDTITGAPSTTDAAIAASADAKAATEAAATPVTSQPPGSNGSTPADKLAESGKATPTASTSSGGVSVAAAVGVNVGTSTTTATVGASRTVNAGGALTVKSSNQTDASASADGSQVDSGNTQVGVGAAVALNAALVTNQATIGDHDDVKAHGVTVGAYLEKPATGGALTLAGRADNFTPDGKSTTANNFSATAKSGAGASNVGVAGTLAVNAVVAKSEAVVDAGAKVDAGGADVTLEATNQATNKTTADAKVANGKAGVGASVGVDVVVNTAHAEAVNGSTLTHAGNVDVAALGLYTQDASANGGTTGAKVSITPVVAANIAVNTTTARLGTSLSTLGADGNLSLAATQKSGMTTTATGQAQGEAAVGASLAAAISVDQTKASLDRDATVGGTIDIAANSATSLTTKATAGAKGAATAKKDASGNETPDPDTTVDAQKRTQLDFAKGTNSDSAVANVKTTDVPAAKTPDVNTQTPDSTTEPTEATATGGDQKGKQVSVAAAIGVGLADNESLASIGAGRKVSTGAGKKLAVDAQTDTNYTTFASGEAVSDNVGVAAAVALTATTNKTDATIGSGTTIAQAGDVSVTATSHQNTDAKFLRTMSAEAISGASGGDVAVAGALAVVGNTNETLASIDEGASLGSSTGLSVKPVGDVVVNSDDTSHVAAAARAGALSKGGTSKAGVGASFAVLLAHNQNTAAIGRDANDNGTFDPTSIQADSLTVKASNESVESLLTGGLALSTFKDINKSSYIDNLDPAVYTGLNYYTEAVAGAASSGNAAVAGAFAVNVLNNTTKATLGDGVSATLTGSQRLDQTHADGGLGLEVSSHSDTRAASFAGGVAGAKQAGVGLSDSDLVDLDQTLASVGKNGTIVATAAGASVSADSHQTIVNIGISGGLGTQSVGIGGVLGLDLSLVKTEASVGAGASLKAQGNVDVLATNELTSVIAAGGVGGGKDAGVGASIAANVIANQTKATIGQGAVLDSTGKATVSAQASETAVTAVIAGAGGGTVGVAGAVSLDLILTDTEASLAQGAKINPDTAYSNAAQSVSITARDDTVVVGAAGGAGGGGKAGVGAAVDTSILIKTVKATTGDSSEVHAKKDVEIDATSTDHITSISAGFAGGGTAGVGGAVSIAVNKNDVQAAIGNSATVDADGNVLVNAQDDVTAVLTAGAGAAGGTAGVGGSLAVATLLQTTKATIGHGATVNALGNGTAATVYSGATGLTNPATQPTVLGSKLTESANGLSVTAYNREDLMTTVVGGAGGGSAGVAATVSANVIASTTEASIGQSAQINADNTNGNADQQVRVKAIDEALLIDTAGAVAGGGAAGVGAAANAGVIAKTTTAKIGKGVVVNAKKAIELDATSSDLSVTTTAGFAGGGSAGVGGAVAGVGVANTTEATIEAGTSAADAAKLKVTAGDLAVAASEFSSSWLVTGAGAGGGAAGVGGSLSVGVNSSTTLAKIGAYAQTDATGKTSVHADSTENVNAITIAGAGGGAAGVSGSISIDVVKSDTEAGIGQHAQVNQDKNGAGQTVEVKATDNLFSIAAAGAGAGAGAAGVGGSAAVTVALNTTSAYIDNNAAVSASQDIGVEATSTKHVNSATVAGAGGGAAGVAGAVSVIAVGSLLDGDAQSGLHTQDANGSTVTTQSQADAQTPLATNSAVGKQLGDSSLSTGAASDLSTNSSNKLAVSPSMSANTSMPLMNTQAYVGSGATVKAGRDLTVHASDTTQAVVASGAGAGAGVAGVAGSIGVVLLHDDAAASVADAAAVSAHHTMTVAAETGDDVYNVGVTGCGAGAAGVCGSTVVNVVTSETAAHIGAANVNQDTTTTSGRSVDVKATSTSNLFTAAGSGAAAVGGVAVGGVLNVNTLQKNTTAYIAAGSNVTADQDVVVAAQSSQNIIGAALSIQGSGAAAVGGAASVNVVHNTTEAYIGANRDATDKTALTTVNSDGNVVVAAGDDTLLVGVSATGTGAGGDAVNGAIAAYILSSQTYAYVGDNASVNARGNASGISVDNGLIGSTAGAMPKLPTGAPDSVNADNNGTSEGSLVNGASFTVSGGNASRSVDPSVANDSQGQAIQAKGGLGTKGTQTITGLAVTATGNEKVVTASMGVAGAGAIGGTGTGTADVVETVTDARIGSGAQVNQTGSTGTAPAVTVLAADNSLVVMASGTVAGGGGAAVSGSVNSAVLGKKTHAHIDAGAKLDASDVVVKASSAEHVYVIAANASVGGGAGVGAATGTAVASNDTQATIGANVGIAATNRIAVTAEADTTLDLYSVAGAGGIVGASGAFSIGVIGNTTGAHVDNGATLDASGATEVTASSTEQITTGTVSAAGGGIGVAGAVGIKVVKSATTADIGDNAQINQTATGTAQDVTLGATDTVTLAGGSGSAAIGAYGAGAAAEVNVVRNTTIAKIGNSAKVSAGRDITVNAESSKDVQSASITAAGGATTGIAGAVTLAFVGDVLDSDADSGLGDGKTASAADAAMHNNRVSSQMGKDEHVQGAKTTTTNNESSHGVASDLNIKTATDKTTDQTTATISSGATLVATRNVNVTAHDSTQLELKAAGAAAGDVGIGGAVAVGVTHSTTQASVGSSASIEAQGNVTVSATADNLDPKKTRIEADTGAFGVLAGSAAVAVMDDHSTTSAYLDDSADIKQAAMLWVTAQNNRQAHAVAQGATVGVSAIGGSDATAVFDGSTKAYTGDKVNIGQAGTDKKVDNVNVEATDAYAASAEATAGSAGIVSGSGAVATATVSSTVDAYLGTTQAGYANHTVSVTATSQASATANAHGVNAGQAAVGASESIAKLTPTVTAFVGSGSTITAGELDVKAQVTLPSSGTAVQANSLAASGGLVGVNGAVSTAVNNASSTSYIGDNSTINGNLSVLAQTDTKQSAEASGGAIGYYFAAGAEVAKATTGTTTDAHLGNGAKVTGTTLTVKASGTDDNYASAIAGSGGIVAGSAADVTTTSTSTTKASTGSGNTDRKLNVSSLDVDASHTTNFNGKVDSVNAAAVGASGASANHTVTSTVTAGIGDGGYVEADDVTVKATNQAKKEWLSGSDVLNWNVLAGSGGAIGVPAGASISHVSEDTTASVGNDATVNRLAKAHIDAVNNTTTYTEGSFTLDATNVIVGHDKVKLDSAGLIALALSDSEFHVDHANATAKFGSNSTVSSELGNINAGSHSEVDIDTRAVANAWGLAGAPAGTAVSAYVGNNSLVVNTGAQLTADGGEVYLGGGQASDGKLSDINTQSSVNLWNKTAGPIITTPDAHSTITSNAEVNILGGANVKAAGDIYLNADKGILSATATGIGKDIYRELAADIAKAAGDLFGGGDVSFDVKGGISSLGGLSTVQVDGTAETGIHRNASLTLDPILTTTSTCATPPCRGANGEVLWTLVTKPKDNIGYTVDYGIGIADNIQKRIDKLRNLKAQYAGDPNAVAAYDAEIKFLQYKMVTMGLGVYDANGNYVPGKASGPSPQGAALNQLAGQESIVLKSVGDAYAAGNSFNSTVDTANSAQSTLQTATETVITNAKTVADNNTNIKSQLQLLAGFNGLTGQTEADYTALNKKISANDQLVADIVALKTANTNDQNSINSKQNAVNNNLKAIDAGNKYQATLVQRALTGDASVAAQIVSQQVLLDKAQTQVNQLTGDITYLMKNIDLHNGDINAKVGELNDNNSIISQLQTSLTKALAGGPSDATVSKKINDLLSSNSTPVGDIKKAVSGIGTSNKNINQAYMDANGFQTKINNSVTDTTRSNAMSQVNTIAGTLPTLDTTAAKSATTNAVTLGDVNLKLGSISIKGDRLIGSGVLSAPGDAQISITNNTPDILITNGLSIDSTSGGTITLNGNQVNNNADINRINGSMGGAAGANFATVLTRDSQGADVAKPSITITSNYDPNSPLYANLPAPAPDIELNGDISNLRGGVSVQSKAGTIYSNGSIVAGTVNIKAENGDFVKSYVDGFYHVGGDEASIYDIGTPRGTGILANGSVIISARYLNINSTVQSGIDQWTLTLTDSPTLTGTPSMFGLGTKINDYQASYDKYPSLNADYDKAIDDWKTRFALYKQYSLLYPDPGSAPTKPTSVGDTVTMQSGGASFTYNAKTKQITYDMANAVTFAKSPEGTANNPSGLYPLLPSNGDNIAAYYDPIKDRFEVNGAKVSGGYIQLFGQIMNTGSDNVGKLRVLDGYGQINVSNQTTKTVVINNLDTGSDPTGTLRGTAGKIDIMDIQSVNNIDHTSQAIHSVYTRDYDPTSGVGAMKSVSNTGTINKNGSFEETGASNIVIDPINNNGRNATYTPQEGLRYVWSTGTDDSTYTNYQVKGTTVLGVEATQGAFPADITIVNQSGPFTKNSYQLENATYLITDKSKINTPFVSTSNTFITSDVRVKTAQWMDCNWWTLCAAQDVYSNWTQTTGTTTITTKSFKADHNIGIDFIGFDQGGLKVDSKADVLVQGAIHNVAGTTTLSSTGSILQKGDKGLISTKNLDLTAAGSIGSYDLQTQTATPLKLAITAGGIINASAANGNVVLSQTLGNLNLGLVNAAGKAADGLGRLMIDAAGDIQGAAGYDIQANLMDLTSRTGTIGSIDTPLKLKVGYTDELMSRGYYGLTASAQNDIGIQSIGWSGNANGDLLVNTVVSQGGDVRLKTAGRIIDNNAIEGINHTTWDGLLKYWDSVGLRSGTQENADLLNQAVASLENLRTQDYRLYWQIRARQADSSVFDPTFTYTATKAERDALNMTNLQIADFETARTAQYHALNTAVGSFTAIFDPNYHYVATQSDKDPLQKGSSWTDRELAISINVGALKEVTNTNPVQKNANVRGNHVTLEADTAIGETKTAVTVPYDVDPACVTGSTCLTDTMKVALAMAERGDLLFNKNDITVLNRKPINFAAPGGLSVNVAGTNASNSDNGNAYLASLGDGVLDTVDTVGDTRIKVIGSIQNLTTSTPAVKVDAGNLILEAANGAIGSTSSPLRIDLKSAATLTARAAGDINLVKSDNLNIDTVYSRSAVNLTSTKGSILDAFADDYLNILGRTVSLHAANGNVGQGTNALEVGVNLDGWIDASASQGVYLAGPLGHSFVVQDVSAAAIDLHSVVNMGVMGKVAAPTALNLSAGADINMAPSAMLYSSAGNIDVQTGSLTMQDGSVTRAEQGTVTIGATSDMIIGHIEATSNASAAAIKLTTNGRILNGGNANGANLVATTAGARLTMQAKGGIGNAKVTAQGIDATTPDALELNVAWFDANSQNGSIQIATAGSMNAGTVQAAKDVTLVSGAGLTASRVTTSVGKVDISSAGAMAVDTVAAGNDAKLVADGDITVTSLSASHDVLATSGRDVVVDTLQAQTGDAVVKTHRDLKLGTVSAGGLADLAAQTGNLTIKQLTADRTNMTSAGAMNASTVQAVKDVTLVSGAGLTASRVTTSVGNVDMSSAGAMAVDTVAAGNDAKLVAGGDITVTSLSASHDVLATAGRDVAVDTLQAQTGDAVVKAHRDLKLGTVSAGGLADLAAQTGNLTIKQLTADRTNMTSAGAMNASTVQAVKDVTLVSGAGLTASRVTTSVGNVDMSSAGAMAVDTVAAGNDAKLVAGGDITVTSLSASHDVLATAGRDVAVDTLQAQTGDAVVKAHRDLKLGTVSAGGLADLAALTGNLNIKQLTANGANTSARHNLVIDNAQANDSVLLSAETISASITGKNPSKPLHGSVTGPQGAPAAQVELTFRDPVGTVLDEFSAVNGNIRVPDGFMAINHGYVQNTATFSNPVTDVLMDNTSKAIRQAADVQLFSSSGSFSNLLLDGWTTMVNDAYVLMRDPDHGVVMNGRRDTSAAEEARSGVESKNGPPWPSRGPLLSLGELLIAPKPWMAAAVQVVDEPASTGDANKSTNTRSKAK